MEPFVFNKLIDPNILYGLYENDYTYIEKIFRTFLDNDIEEDLELIRLCYASGDLEGIRKITHKIKPAFGFMGMPAIEKKCGMLEEMCRTHSSTNQLTTELNALLEVIKEGKSALEGDLQKLVIFNKT